MLRIESIFHAQIIVTEISKLKDMNPYREPFELGYVKCCEVFS